MASSDGATLARKGEAEGDAVAVQTPPGHTLTGDFRRHPKFRSRFLPSDHTLLVYRPPGYKSDRVRRFPVLYLQDGQNVFDRATSATGDEWAVDETAQRLIESGVIEPLIIVGIYNAGERRIDEYTPTRDEKKKVGGKAAGYAKMLAQEIKPFIDRRYRTLRSAANTGLGGSSLGGLLTMHLGLRYPTVFNRLAVLSPSIWWNDRAVVREADALGAKPPLRIWLDAGTNEGAEVLQDTRLLRDALVRKGWVEGVDLAYMEADGGGHNEQSWATRVEGVLRFLFPAVRKG
ncbi:MAG: alpha/beta hydrolase [Gemmatimonadaceae bacterium]